MVHKLLRKNQKEKKGTGDGGFQVPQTVGMESTKLKQPATDTDESPFQQAALARSKVENAACYSSSEVTVSVRKELAEEPWCLSANPCCNEKCYECTRSAAPP